MTRINAYINPVKLLDTHLIAEIKEINQLCGSIAMIKNRDIPKNFTLGTGHVKFFLDKGLYLSKRFNHLKSEARRRNFNVLSQFNYSVWNDNTYKDFIPNDIEIIRIQKVLANRISERILNQKQEPRYYSNYITKEHAINILFL